MSDLEKFYRIANNIVNSDYVFVELGDGKIERFIIRDGYYTCYYSPEDQSIWIGNNHNSVYDHAWCSIDDLECVNWLIGYICVNFGQNYDLLKGVDIEDPE